MSSDGPIIPGEDPGNVYEGDEGSVTTNGWSVRGGPDSAVSPDYPPLATRIGHGEERSLLVRGCRQSDLGTLANMYEAVGGSSLGLPPATRPDVETWLASLLDEGWNLLARCDDTVVGHVGVVPADAAAPELVVFVRDDYQNCGIGTALVERAVEHAVTEGYEALTLLVPRRNRAAIAVYTKVGFRAVVRTAVEYEMRLPLDSRDADLGRSSPAPGD